MNDSMFIHGIYACTYYCVTDINVEISHYYYFLTYVNWKVLVNNLCTLVTNGTYSISSLSSVIKFTHMDFTPQVTLIPPLRFLLQVAWGFSCARFIWVGVMMVRLGVLLFIDILVFCCCLAHTVFACHWWYIFHIAAMDDWILTHVTVSDLSLYYPKIIYITTIRLLLQLFNIVSAVSLWCL